ncbi:unnamed protein product [Didymodactylos carnosus]|uniref:Uncharacterized protein n=1 Tax=Didymodactylos carnosus TaxID=1234261 RepID=A0A8S2F934_9BILA|nr:unnamed protein product [Didymodactylos carnosus]CAF4183879.1 unnamed protein product [Didymodactylos carnosus]
MQHDCNATRHLLNHLINTLYSFEKLEKSSSDGKVSGTIQFALSTMTVIDNHTLKLYGSHYCKSKMCTAKQREGFTAQKAYLSKNRTVRTAI